MPAIRVTVAWAGVDQPWQELGTAGSGNTSFWMLLVAFIGVIAINVFLGASIEREWRMALASGAVLLVLALVIIG